MILLTGANGFLGREIGTGLKRYDLDYLTLGRSPNNAIQWDLGVRSPVIIPPVDLVLHAAGKAHVVPANAEERADFFTVNVLGTKNFLDALENNSSLRKFIFFSSVSVYGLTEGSGITEEAPLLAKDPYGESKIQAEKLVSDWCIKRNIEYYILRLPLIAGKNPPGNLGAMIKGIQSGRYMSIGKARAKKSMVLANDLPGFVTTLHGRSGVYNLTDGYHPSFYELELAIATFFGKKKPFSLPSIAATMIGFIGDIAGEKFPVNSSKLKKITNTLTFDDTSARTQLQWRPREVLKAWEIK